jgi:hypothetical protein
MAKTSYSARIATYLDREIRAVQRGSDYGAPVSESVSFTLFDTFTVALRRLLRQAWWLPVLSVVGIAGIIASLFVSVPYLRLGAVVLVTAAALALVVLVLRALIGALGAVGAVAPEVGLAQLDVQLDRLQQVREWLKDDNLRRLIDAAIGEQVQTSERRQRRLTAVWSVAGILAGWLLSLLGSPASLIR